MAKTNPGHLMTSETAQAPAASIARLTNTAIDPEAVKALETAQAIYTVARGSSDAAANVLSYEFMRHLDVPVTSLPPSVFSLGTGVRMAGATSVLISQSGKSPDLVACAKGARLRGGRVIGLVNAKNSPVEDAANATLSIMAGPELAVPATKSVICSIAAGMALLSAVRPDYGENIETTAQAFAKIDGKAHPNITHIVSSLLRARNVYVIGRGAGFGAAHEVALKLKECCALHAEAYSASEVLHGPLQLVTNPLTVIILDTDEAAAQHSIDQAEKRFLACGAAVLRIRPSDMKLSGLCPAGAAAVMLYMLYPAICQTALALSFNPDTPDTLSKVTSTV